MNINKLKKELTDELKEMSDEAESFTDIAIGLRGLIYNMKYLATKKGGNKLTKPQVKEMLKFLDKKRIEYMEEWAYDN